MLIATSVAVAGLASSLLTTRPLTPLPPLVIDVIAASDISPSLVTRVLTEAGDIWRAAGLTIIWKQDSHVSAAPRVTIGHWGNGVRREENALPLGWIAFDERGTPANAIYVSYANATALLDHTRGIGAVSDRMPRAEQETLLGRAMGRALAHELGHYLLGSKVHSAKGLMRAQRTSVEFFSTERSKFDVDAQQISIIAARLAPQPLVATLQSALVVGR